MCPSESERRLPLHVLPETIFNYMEFKYLFPQMTCTLTSKFYCFMFSKYFNTLKNALMWHSALPIFLYLISFKF